MLACTSCLGLVSVGKLDVLEIGLANARRLGRAEVALAEQLAHDDALPVAGLERLGRDISDVAGCDHRDGEVRRNGVHRFCSPNM